MIAYKVDIDSYKDYFPTCYKHGFLKQYRDKSSYKWQCREVSCKSQAFGLSYDKFIDMMIASKAFIINSEDRREISKELNYFPLIAKSEISLILEAIFNQNIEYKNSWNATLSLINDVIEKMEYEKLESIKKDLRLRADIEHSEYVTSRICRLCGTSTCQTINACMDTSF